MRLKVRPMMGDKARALVDGHLAAGDVCVVITATNSFVTAPIVREFGIKHLIATDPEQKDGEFTGGGDDCARGGEQQVVAGFERHPVLGAHPLDGGVAAAAERGVVAVDVDRVDAGLLDQPRHHPVRLALEAVEPAAGRGELLVEVLERLDQELEGRLAEVGVGAARLARVEDEARHHLGGGGAGGAERGVVVEPQVAAEEQGGAAVRGGGHRPILAG
jgi:hypothetical protein